MIIQTKTYVFLSSVFNFLTDYKEFLYLRILLFGNVLFNSIPGRRFRWAYMYALEFFDDTIGTVKNPERFSEITEC